MSGGSWWRGAVLVLGLMVTAVSPALSADPPGARRPRNDAETRYWLHNMLTLHNFSLAEAAAATGLTDDEVARSVDRLKIDRVPAAQPAGGRLTVVPYPGGRHPRIGFLDGAVDPQRETKVSVFTPWDPRSYVVVDVPEAIWSNLGLLYLAHTHVPTLWTKQGVTLEPLEWNRRADGALDIVRELPNRVRFQVTVVPAADCVQMEIALTNGTSELLTDLRVQNCVMLKGAHGFEEQTSERCVFSPPYAACRSRDHDRWIVTAWEPCHRAWGNPPCPCLHSDPRFADCPPGETRRVKGRLWFFVGRDVEGEFRRLDATAWREAK